MEVRRDGNRLKPWRPWLVTFAIVALAAIAALFTGALRAVASAMLVLVAVASIATLILSLDLVQDASYNARSRRQGKRSRRQRETKWRASAQHGVSSAEVPIVNVYLEWPTRAVPIGYGENGRPVPDMTEMERACCEVSSRAGTWVAHVRPQAISDFVAAAVVWPDDFRIAPTVAAARYQVVWIVGGRRVASTSFATNQQGRKVETLRSRFLRALRRTTAPER